LPRRCGSSRSSMLQVAITEEQVEAALAAGTLACPACSGPLSPWGFARSRELRLRSGTRELTPRRTRCGGCARTHVVCPAFSVPRRRDSAEVIGEALRLAVDGEGHRRIARVLDRPPGTVRGWLRAARRHAQELRACATRQLVMLDVEVGAATPAGSQLVVERRSNDSGHASANSVRLAPPAAAPWFDGLRSL
jgi:transposase-like protein